MTPLIEFIFGGSLAAWGWVDATCGMVLLAEMAVLLGTQSGANSQRRWAALGPFVAAMVALVLAWVNWEAERTFILAVRYCSFVLSDPGCRDVTLEVYAHIHIDLDALGWLIIGATVALAFVTASLLVSRAKPQSTGADGM